MDQAAARTVSILGHPMLVLPMASVALAGSRGHWPTAAWLALGFIAFAAMVMGYSRWQVRRGNWAHVDASQRGERKSLNRFLLVCLCAASACALWVVQSRELALGLALSAAIVAVAMLSTRLCKLSLHMAFVVFASLVLLAVSLWAALVGFAFAIAVAWSRLALQRHEPRDLAAGAVAGLVAGSALLFFTGGVSG